MNEDVTENFEEHEPSTGNFASVFGKVLTQVVTNDGNKVTKHDHIHRFLLTSANEQLSFATFLCSALCGLWNVEKLFLVDSSENGTCSEHG